MRLKPDHPALTEARTIHARMVRLPSVLDKMYLLKSAAGNSKLGNGLGVILKGKWRGFPLYSLTLQERATCPTSCNRWAECYGNGMGFAHRFEHGAALEMQLEYEVGVLARMYPHGFAIRLHILGDFYSVEYAMLWKKLLEKHKNLHVYGYTARSTGAIADALRAIRVVHGNRWWVRISSNNEQGANHPTDIYAAQEGAVDNAITCPEQTGLAQSCLDCGLCWSINKTIEFVDHDKLAKERKNGKARSATA